MAKKHDKKVKVSELTTLVACVNCGRGGGTMVIAEESKRDHIEIIDGKKIGSRRMIPKKYKHVSCLSAKK